MKKNTVYILLIFLAAAATAAWLVNLKQESTALESGPLAEKRLEDLSLPIAIDSKPKSGDESAAASKSVSQNAIQEEFYKCFNKETSIQSLESMKTALLQQKDYSTPSLNEESYELVGNDQKDLVVQYIPQEENQNKVRVFSINPTDGLPDRIKNFPHNSGDVSVRLKGALSMGSVKSRTVSTTQSAYDGSLLSIDQKDDKIIRLHLITAGFDFECKEQSCQCLKKE